MTTTLTGYQIEQLLYDGTRTLVYRGVKTDDSKPVVLKKLRKEYPTFNELLQFRHQYILSKNLDLPGIVRPITLEKYGNAYVLVMEDVGGVSLSEYISDRPLSIEEFFRCAIAITKILSDLYRNRVIHKDIKPANILINQETKEIYLIDFSISSLLPRETQEIKNPNVLEGTLAYISPEQTGRMNRGIDYRSDFYSLGVTLYELLTGELPFKSEEPMELVHCHIAKEAIPPHKVKSEIPQALSEIVMKLMAKTVEERYQSAKGIERDLEKCWEQWQKTGSITDFKLGEGDLSDRFLIPEKLYGREAEVQTLLAAFNRAANGSSEMMLVAGFSGIGKTAVVNEVHKPIVEKRGYFIKGKFDQFQRNIPFSALVQAFRDLMGQLLSESDDRLERWKTAILNALGENARLIIEVIPELEQIIGKQPDVAELSGSAAQNRFNLLFPKFIRVFTTPDHPLVIFVDDLQWADSSSLKLMQLLMDDSQTTYLLLLGAYRDNEVFAAHPLMLTLDELAKSGATLNTITLTPLSQTELNRLVADTLCCELKLALPLTELVYQKTKGNPFFATQFLKSLHQDGWIEFNFALGHWQCDMTRVRSLALTDDVVEFMATRLYKLPFATQEILKLAACIGNQFDLQTLAVVCEQSELEAAQSLWAALLEGLVLPVSETYKFFQGANREEKVSAEELSVGYKFLHDRVQQAAYSLIPDSDKKATHLKIGQLLQQNYSEIEQEEKLFDIVEHLNQGQELIAHPQERENLAKLNLKAGVKARNSTAYTAAKIYLQIGIELLTESCWQDRYELTLNLYVAATEVAYLNAELDEMEEMAALVLQEARTILDKVKIYQIKIIAQIAKGKMLEAIAIARDALLLLGFEFPAEANEATIRKALQTVASQQSTEIEELIELPVMRAPKTQAAMQLLGMLPTAIFQGMPGLMPILSATMVSLSLQFGNAPESAVGYVIHGMVTSAFGSEVETGYRFGRLALKLLDRFNAPELKCMVLLNFGGFLQHRRESLRAMMPTVKDGYVAGMETGDFTTAGYCISNYINAKLFSGVELETLESEIAVYREVFVQVKQDSARAYMEVEQQMVQNLRETQIQSDCLIGDVYDETVMLPKHHQDSELTAIAFAYIYKLLLAYLFGNYTSALNYSAEAKKYLMAVSDMVFIPIFHFYTALTHLALFSTKSEIEQAEVLASVETHQTTLHQWAKNAPMNYQHKWYLVEAERQRVLGNKAEAIDLYDRAISLAKENQFLNEEALANELAAKFYLDWGKEKVASGYMQDAYYCYARWGAKAKTDDLEKRYPQLLTPILERQKLGLTPTATIATLTTGTISHTSAGTAEILDLATLMKASRTLSAEIELEGAIANLMQVARENAGAETAALMLFQDSVLILTALVRGEDAPQIDPIPVETSNAVPLSIVNKVKRTRKPLVLDNASNETACAGDAYILQHQPKSILCLPLSARSQLIGILYLENNRVAGAFTGDRVEVLSLLCSQAAISLENARLYRKSQNYAQQLEQTQLQLVQSEKMATVGQLTAGIAHEINNPVGFISGNLTYASDYIQDLIRVLNLYRETFPQPGEKIEEEMEAIELDYLIEDLPQTIDSMKEGIERITEISKSMRTFSRGDTAAKIAFNLHDGIDSTLLILKHRLKANENRPSIEVVKNYGDLPEVNCYPGQLNQVFMNLIANAIDAFDEGNIGRTFEEIKATPNRIAITTEIDKEKQVAMVKIKDNGIGMSKEVKGKVFEHLFTTKGVGKGTGLGLSISRQIVEEKHGGKITLISAEGKGTEFAIALPCN